MISADGLGLPARFSEPIPRKGTETKHFRHFVQDVAGALSFFRTYSPQGDGNGRDLVAQK